VPDNCSIVSRSSCEGAAIAYFLLYVANNGSFRTLRDRENIANSESGFFPRVDKSTSMQTLGRNKSLLAKLVAVRVTENDTSKRSAATNESDMMVALDTHYIPTSIVDYLFYNATNVSISLCVIERPELGWRLVMVGMCLELQEWSVFLRELLYCRTYDGMRSPLRSNNSSHY
jgi:hypothetical protein